jgi:hypothetical protein
MTSVANSIAWGSTLIDWRSNSVLHVPDPFLLSSLSRPKSAATTDRFGRALAQKAPAPRRIDLAKAMAGSPRGGPSDANLPA